MFAYNSYKSGFRHDSTVSFVGVDSEYWSSSADGSYAYNVQFNSSNVSPDVNDCRYYGGSVRLITESK